MTDFGIARKIDFKFCDESQCFRLSHRFLVLAEKKHNQPETELYDSKMQLTNHILAKRCRQPLKQVFIRSITFFRNILQGTTPTKFFKKEKKLLREKCAVKRLKKQGYTGRLLSKSIAGFKILQWITCYNMLTNWQRGYRQYSRGKTHPGHMKTHV